LRFRIFHIDMLTDTWEKKRKEMNRERTCIVRGRRTPLPHDPGNSQSRPPIFNKLMESSFSAVSTANKDAFCNSFRDLQGLHSFAPLQSQKFSQISSDYLAIFAANSAMFAICCSISSFPTPILMKVFRKFAKFWKCIC
jgi:hypothetical protein